MQGFVFIYTQPTKKYPFIPLQLLPYLSRKYNNLSIKSFSNTSIVTSQSVSTLRKCLFLFA